MSVSSSPVVTGYLTRRAERRAAVRADRARARRSAELVDDFADLWRRLCEFVGLSYTVSVAAGPTVVTPRLVGADQLADGGVVLVVQLLPGQLPAHFQAVAHQLAPALGAQRVRIVPRGLHWIRVELLHADPLNVDVTARTPTAGRSVNDHPVTIAQDEDRTAIARTWVDTPHAVVQGATRSGKSVWCYSTLAQLAALDDVLIAGCDPSGLLLGRPYAGTRHQEWQSTGTRDVLAHRDALDQLVDEMDRRLATLPPRVDKLDRFSPDLPLIVVVLEEFPGLLGFASTLPTPRNEPKVRDQLLQRYGRLVAEGHKVGLRVLVVTQRADASILGGFQRGQLGLRISFRVADREAIPMLHQDARDHAADHAHAAPGIALFEAPDRTLCRVRGPRLPGPSEATDYARYWDEIAAASARLHAVAA